MYLEASNYFVKENSIKCCDLLYVIVYIYYIKTLAEMRMLRWTCAVTELDKIRNERIRGTTKVGKIAKKVEERRLKWYWHVMRRDEHYVGRRAMVMKVL